MPQVVGETGCLDEIGIDEIIVTQKVGHDLEALTDTAPDLGHLDGMRQPCPVKIVVTREENLGLILKSPKCSGVNDAITILLKRSPVILEIDGRGFISPFDIKTLVKMILHFLDQIRIRVTGMLVVQERSAM